MRPRTPPRRRRAALALGLAVAALPARAGAGEPPPGFGRSALPSLPATRYTPPAEPPPPDPMRVRWAVDLPILGVSAAIWAAGGLMGRELRWAGCAACDPARLNALDRTAIGNADHAAKIVSDVGYATLAAAPLLLDLGDALLQRSRDASPARPRHLRAWGKDAVVLLEVLAVDSALTNLVKFAVRRPRPYSYDPETAVGDPLAEESRLSFFSGHTSAAFAMATAYAYLFQVRHPRSRWVAPVYVIGLGLASVTGVARVAAGKHFWTDVLAGAVAGASIGVLIPALHRSRLPGAPRLSLAPMRPGLTVLLSGRF